MKDKIDKILTEIFKANHMEYQNARNELSNLHSFSGSFCDKDLLNAYCAGALETLTNKEATFLGYDHLNKIKKEAEEWKKRYTNDR